MLPALPPGWYAESALRSAGGTPFAGDFVVATRPGTGDRLEIVVVDVSGKGEQAGTRALLLSGAFGGLLSALPPADFLPAANDYLLRQDWERGLRHRDPPLPRPGDRRLRDPHRRATRRPSSSRRLRALDVHETEGPVLGLIEDAEFDPVRGRLRRGDALLLYTDGMVETRGRDIGLGHRPDARPGRAAAARASSGAARLVDALGSQQRRPRAGAGPPALSGPRSSVGSGARGVAR